MRNYVVMDLKRVTKSTADHIAAQDKRIEELKNKIQSEVVRSNGHKQVADKFRDENKKLRSDNVRRRLAESKLQEEIAILNGDVNHLQRKLIEANKP